MSQNKPDQKEIALIDQREDGTNAISVFRNQQSFAEALTMAKWLAASDLVPKQFQGKAANCLISMELAQRIGASPFMVMQNVHIIHGRPGWSSQFIIAAINNCGRFSPLRFNISDPGRKQTVEAQIYIDKRLTTITEEIKNQTCYAYATELKTGDEVKGPEVSVVMAVEEGWFSKAGSKWKAMPDLMLRYRAATFFGRLNCPDILMGMKTSDELEDIDFVPPEAELKKRTEAQANKGPVIDIQNDQPDSEPPGEAGQLEDSPATQPDTSAEDGGKGQGSAEPAPEEENHDHETVLCPEREGDFIRVKFCNEMCKSRKKCKAFVVDAEYEGGKTPAEEEGPGF